MTDPEAYFDIWLILSNALNYHIHGKEHEIERKAQVLLPINILCRKQFFGFNILIKWFAEPNNCNWLLKPKEGKSVCQNEVKK